MTIYHTYIDDNVGLGSSTIAGIQTNGSIYGVGISSNGYFSGIVTASSFVGDGSGLTGVTGTGSGIIIRDDGTLVGTAATINFGDNLSVSPVSAGIVTVTGSGSSFTGNADTADQVSTGTTTGTGTYYPTFVDSNNSTAAYEALYTDAGISYNPSTNLLGIGTISPIRNLHISNDTISSEIVMQVNSFAANRNRWNFVVDQDTVSGTPTHTKFYIRQLNQEAAGGEVPFLITSKGEVLVGSDVVISTPTVTGFPNNTGTPNQKLQVTGGAYISGNLGIGATNPGEKLQVDGNIRVGISTISNYIAFRGTFADGTNGSGDEDQSVELKRWQHTYIGERIYDYSAVTERSELLLFKGNDLAGPFGPDRVRVLAGEFRVDIGGGSGTFEQVGNSLSTNALIVTDAGNIGVGITNPTAKLHVNGSVSKGSGSFVIDHPLSETKNLVHSFIEGPRADLIYRGTVSLIDGSAIVNLDEEYELIPGTWKALCRNPQVWISNIDGWTNCRGTVEDGILIIEAQTASNESVNWLVIAERQDKHMYDTEWTDDNGRPILEPVKL